MTALTLMAPDMSVLMLKNVINLRCQILRFYYIHTYRMTDSLLSSRA
jgi:hypothetical protein